MIGKYSILFAAIFPLASLGQGQTELAVHAAPSMSTLLGSFALSGGVEPLFTYNAGVNLLHAPNKVLRFSVGLEYENKGYRRKVALTDNFGNNNGEYVFVESRLNSIQLPLTVGAALFNNRLLIQGGPYIGYIVSAKGRTYDTMDIFDSTTDDKGSYNAIEVGALAQITYRIPLGESASLDIGPRASGNVLNTLALPGLSGRFVSAMLMVRLSYKLGAKS